MNNVKLYVLSTGRIKIECDGNVVGFIGEICTDGFHAVVSSLNWLSRADSFSDISDEDMIKLLYDYYSNFKDKNQKVIFTNDDWSIFVPDDK